MTDLDPTDDHVVECANCGELVSIMEAASGMGRKPVHKDCFNDR